jgi:hypothetical protein
MIDVLSAFGLAAATGLNAYLPLLIVGLMARYTDLVTLRPPFNALENPVVLGVLGVLLVIQTVVRPAAGAIIFAASANVISEMHPAMALICGLLAASSVHAVKATGRPLITATTAGVGNPIVSTAEDVVAGVTTVVAILVPALAATVIIALIVFLAWRLLRRRQRRLAAQA